MSGGLQQRLRSLIAIRPSGTALEIAYDVRTRSTCPVATGGIPRDRSLIAQEKPEIEERFPAYRPAATFDCGFF
jgi:hypothetical protein